jgi:hypothetical protein
MGAMVIKAKRLSGDCHKQAAWTPEARAFSLSPVKWKRGIGSG